jgi:signal peptidase II
MLILIPLLLLVPLADQALKVLLRRRLAGQALALGPLGSVRVVESRVWLSRIGAMSRTLWLAIGWTAAAGWLVAVTLFWLPAQSTWCAGLLLGGSLSHLLETAVRGRVTDYVCLRFWPAFNLADAAVLSGVLGLLVACLQLFWRVTA